MPTSEQSKTKTFFIAKTNKETQKPVRRNTKQGKNIWNTDTQTLMFLICKELLINEVTEQEKEIPINIQRVFNFIHK